MIAVECNPKIWKLTNFSIEHCWMETVFLQDFVASAEITIFSW